MRSENYGLYHIWGDEHKLKQIISKFTVYAVLNWEEREKKEQTNKQNINQNNKEQHVSGCYNKNKTTEMETLPDIKNERDQRTVV